MKRIFIAVPIPEKIKPLLHSMGKSLPGARAVPEEQIHITLRFIGEVDGTTFLDIKEQLAEVSRPSFSLGISGVGHFPPRGKPRVVWAGLQPTDELSQLKRQVDTQLIKCGITPDTRKFSPHITLARLNTTSLQRVTDFLSGNAFLRFDDFAVSAFHLYSSKLSHKGATHTLEASYPLQAI